MNAAQIPFPRCPATVHIGALALGAKAAAIGVIVGYLHTARATSTPPASPQAV